MEMFQDNFFLNAQMSNVEDVTTKLVLLQEPPFPKTFKHLVRIGVLDSHTCPEKQFRGSKHRSSHGIWRVLDV